MTTASDQRSTTQGGSAPVPPGLRRPRKDDMREVGIIAGILLMLALGIGGYWMYQAQTDTRSKATVTRASSTKESWKQTAPPVAGKGASKASLPSAMPVSTTMASAGHSSTDPEVRVDIYFDFDRSTLNEDAQSVLKQQVGGMRTTDGWIVAIQGYTDKVGPASYNKRLGLRRAQAAKEYLVTLGVPEHSIRVSSAGEDDDVCRGHVASCSKKKRRVHVQWSKLEPSPLTSTDLKSIPLAKGATASDSSAAAVDRKEDRARKDHPVKTANVSK